MMEDEIVKFAMTTAIAAKE